MDINAFNAVRAYGAAQKVLKPEAGQPGAPGVGPQGEFRPEKLLNEMAGTLGKSETAASQFMVGQADPHSVVEALAAAELAVETAVTLRNKVVEAYQELMRMPV